MGMRFIASIFRHFSPDGQMQQKTLTQRSAIIGSQQLLRGEEGEEEPREDEEDVSLLHQLALQGAFVVKLLDDDGLVGRQAGHRGYGFDDLLEVGRVDA